MSRSNEDWQVKQADYSLRLYDFFLSRQDKQPSSGSAVIEKEWIMVEDETRKVLRLRHLSLSTEKSYIIWLRQFQGFVEPKSPRELEGMDLQNFLTHLAVERRVSSAT